MIKAARLPARAGQPPRPVPERTGEPSVFKHVVYIIKENRTYDQVFGDVEEGNGDASLCVFGARITPNQHKLAREREIESGLSDRVVREVDAKVYGNR